jgi:hypothetical protein
MFSNILKTFIFALTVITSLHSPTASADIERMNIYGSKHDAEFIWRYLEFEYDYPYSQFIRDYTTVDAKAALQKACNTAHALKPNDCGDRPPQLSQPRTNGCSNAPDGSFLGSCNLHDICYDDVSATKGSCDTAFKADLHDACDDNYPQSGFNKICRGTANVYYGAVVIAGDSAYYSSQKEAKCAAWWAAHDATCGKL